MLAERWYPELFEPIIFTPRLSAAIQSDTLPELLGLSPVLVILLWVSLIGAFLVLYPKPAEDFNPFRWYVVGGLIGIVGTLAWMLGKSSGWHWGLSMVGPTRSLYHVVVDQAPEKMTWGSFMILGIPAGSLLSAWIRGSACLQIPEVAEFPRRFIGGFMMGVGGTLAAGCNIGNALTGLSVLSLNSVVATGGIIAGLALGVRVQESKILH